ncbi:MAG: helix-turn-helix transcriptional regulator [Alphaproteobacteria bacterium]|nr:helix-turn-helix transcriptional regulator [Alphaproteobacteria bacterium]
MSLSNIDARKPAVSGFPHLLKLWRQKRRLSQLELALTSGVSQRHVSFLESGRANPSRGMILQLSETLEVPLRERNDWLVAAGFAPVFRARHLDDPQMAQVLSAVRMMLANHEPFPAIAIDRAWNIRLTNTSFDRLGTLLGSEIWTRIGGLEHNLMRLFFHPNGIKPYIANWGAIAPLLWHRARREAEALGGEEMKMVLSDLSQHQDAETLWAAEELNLVPVLPIEIVKDGARVSLFTVIATFGTAQDVTADELRIESFFPADTATEQLFRSFQAAV